MINFQIFVRDRNGSQGSRFASTTLNLTVIDINDESPSIAGTPNTNVGDDSKSLHRLDHFYPIDRPYASLKIPRICGRMHMAALAGQMERLT